MGSRTSRRRRSAWALAMAPVLALAGLFMAGGVPAGAATLVGAAAHATRAAASVTPNKINNLDCNGWSPKYGSVSPSHRMDCTDPRGAKPYKGWSSSSSKYSDRGRFEDNGHYVGHDEPSVKFISHAAGSGYTMTYFMKLPHDPAAAPTPSGSVTTYAELSVAPWFGLPICDPGSYPENPCTPHSDSNSGSISNPKDAGSAFMELQFYPPGFTPFPDNTSCSTTKWCSALTIDSLESKFNFADLNPDCEEPVNFAFLQKNGVPAGPPSPQLADASTELPNAQTLEMNPGDVLKVAITDPLTGSDAGFTTTVTDMTTHQTGYMIASAGNGFMNTNYKTCAGTLHTFHAEYNTASQQNQVPWAALEGGVLMEQETGHSEACNSVANKDPVSETFGDGQSYSDPQVYDTCMGGGSEGPHAVGEGPCNGSTGICKNPTTEGTTGPIACPSDSFVSGQLCEYADGFCFQKGTRTAVINGVKTKESVPISWCADNRFQNGDLDFDGVPYQRGTWPDGSPNHPTSIRYVGPFSGGKMYPQIQFESDIPGSEFLCNVETGNNCDVPPLGSKFYPYWTLTSKQPLAPGLFPSGSCVWNFGGTIPNVTTQRFGGDAEYGVSDVARFGGTDISAVRANPAETGKCPAFNQP
jgi:hypothetical protein